MKDLGCEVSDVWKSAPGEFVFFFSWVGMGWVGYFGFVFFCFLPSGKWQIRCQADLVVAMNASWPLILVDR